MESNEKSSLMYKLCSRIGIVLCIILIPILIINCVLIVKSQTNEKDVPNIGGTLPLIVLTKSMDPVIKSGDLIICHTAEATTVKKGDIISFYDPAGNGTSIVTHRVKKVIKNKDGKIAWITKGDANNVEDTAIVSEDKLVGVYQTSIHGLGNIAMFMQSTKGIVICVICPIIFLLGYDTIRRRIQDKHQKKETDQLLEELNKLRSKSDI